MIEALKFDEFKMAQIKVYVREVQQKGILDFKEQKNSY